MWRRERERGARDVSGNMWNVELSSLRSAGRGSGSEIAMVCDIVRHDDVCVRVWLSLIHI